MKMSIKPRYLLVAAAAAFALYFAGVPVGTLLLIAVAAYMMSMHLGGHGGHGGGGHGDVGPVDLGTSTKRAGPAGVPPAQHITH